MKLIFLDFDGVLNRFDEPESYRKLSKSCVENLNFLIEKSEAKIIISSTWRRIHSLSDLRQIMKNAGFRFPQSIIGETPCGGPTRGREIEKVLEMSGGRYEPCVFVILDDDSDMEPFMDRLIQTSSDIGLSMKDVEKVLRLLGD